MKFALFLLGSWTEPEVGAQSRIFGEMMEQVEYAEELGFDSIWIAEHHSSRYGICPSLMPLLCHIAARTKKIRIGAGVSVLPFHNPIFLAEESAMLDVLSNGRLDFGVGRGSADYEYGNFGIDFDTRDGRTQEALDIILGLWTQSNFSFRGEFYEVKDLTIAPRPVQQAPSAGVPGRVAHAHQRGRSRFAGFAHHDQFLDSGGGQPGTVFPVCRAVRCRRQGSAGSRDALLPVRVPGRGRT